MGDPADSLCRFRNRLLFLHGRRRKGVSLRKMRSVVGVKAPDDRKG